MTKTICPLDGQDINYKNVELLKKYVTKFGKITPRYYSGVSLKNQKKLANAIIEAQRKEIEEMKAMIKRLENEK